MSSSYDFIIYTKKDCKWCVEAKKLIKEKNLTYREKSVDNIENLSYLKRINPNVKTVPQIYQNNRLVGGYEQLKEMLK